MKDVTALILAGGMATRMRPITQKIPKSLIEINNKPFIDYQIELLEQQGFKRIILSVGYKGKMIENYLKQKNRLCDIKFSYDGENLLGTGGAVKNALSLLSDTFLVLYGDSYLKADYAPIVEYFNERKKSFNSLMTVYKNKDYYDTSNVLFKGGKIINYSKSDKSSDMQHVDWGLSVFHQSAFINFEEKKAFDLSEVFTSTLKSDQLVAYEVFDRFYEIGSVQGLEELKKFLY